MLEAWYAAFVPPGTPPAIVAQLNAEMNKALKDPKLIDTFTKGAIEPVGGGAGGDRQAGAGGFGEIRAAGEGAEHQDAIIALQISASRFTPATNMKPASWMA